MQGIRHRGIPKDSFVGDDLPLTDFTPRPSFNGRLWFPRLCQEVIRTLIRWQSSASDQVTL
jgi:hypothetical protein